MNTKVYTHEFIDIRGAKRPDCMHHMTANWSPIAQEERHQLGFFPMLDAALSPLRIARQPAPSDRVDSWDEG